MGLESHIDRELQRAATGLVHGEDYWFYDGLRVKDEKTGRKIIEALEASGEFGPARLKFTSEPGEPPLISWHGECLIEFGIHQNHWHFPSDEYHIYARNFKAGAED